MQEDPSLIILLSTLIFLLILSGFFSGSETGMMAANKIKLKNLSKKSKTSAKRALNLLKRPDQLLSAILVGNNFANILASAIVTIIMLNYFGGNVLLGSIILTIVIYNFNWIIRINYLMSKSYSQLLKDIENGEITSIIFSNLL